jgi:hypothetical protein
MPQGPDAVTNGGAASGFASSAMQRTTAELPLESAATEVVMSPTLRQQVGLTKICSYCNCVISPVHQLCLNCLDSDYQHLASWKVVV